MHLRSISLLKVKTWQKELQQMTVTQSATVIEFLHQRTLTQSRFYFRNHFCFNQDRWDARSVDERHGKFPQRIVMVVKVFMMGP